MNREVTLEELEATIKKANYAADLYIKNNHMEEELERLRAKRMELEEQKNHSQEQSKEEGNSHGLK